MRRAPSLATTRTPGRRTRTRENGRRPRRDWRPDGFEHLERLEDRRLLTGVPGWAVQAGSGTGDNEAGQVAVDKAGDVYCRMSFSGTATFRGTTGSATLTSAGGTDIAVVAYAPDGTLLWARRMGGPLDDKKGGIVVDDSDPNPANWSVYVAGYFQGTADFGPYSLTSRGPTDVFVAKLDPSYGVVAGRAYNDLNDDGQNDDGTFLAGRTVTLDGLTTTTDAQGNYKFVGLAPGGHTLGQAEPVGWTSSSPPGGSASVTLGVGQTPVVDLGSYTPNTQNTYSSGTVNLGISGSTTVRSTINVPDALALFYLRVTLNITYPSDGDLGITLVAPDGTQVPLVRAGSLRGQNLTGTTFDDQGSTPIGFVPSVAPYSGSYQPNGSTPLSALEGKGIQGAWTLVITDSTSTKKNQGTLKGWSLLATVPTTPGVSLSAAAVAPSLSPAMSMASTPSQPTPPPAGANPAGGLAVILPPVAIDQALAEGVALLWDGAATSDRALTPAFLRPRRPRWAGDV